MKNAKSILRRTKPLPFFFSFMLVSVSVKSVRSVRTDTLAHPDTLSLISKKGNRAAQPTRGRRYRLQLRVSTEIQGSMRIDS